MSAVAEQFEMGMTPDGMTLYTASSFPYRMDWFQGTTKVHTFEEVMEAFGGEWVETRAVNSFERACTNGRVTVQCSPVRDARANRSQNPNFIAHGVQVIITGKSDPTAYYDLLVKLKFVPSRFDIAFDTDKMTVSEVWQAYNDGHIQCLAREDNVKLTSKRAGEQTIDFKCARHHVCVYDKAAEQKISGVTWTRIEYRFLGTGAKDAWADMSNIIKRCHKIFRMMKRKYAAMHLGKLDHKFAVTVRDGHWLSDNPYAKLIIMSFLFQRRAGMDDTATAPAQTSLGERLPWK